MPLLDLQRQLRRLGKLRMGDTVETSGGKTRPAKLDTWRITSPSRPIVDELARIHGGEVEAWASPDGPQWEVVTNTDTLDVVVPPGDYALSQWNEQWSVGGCQRRCDGYTETLTGLACMCPADGAERRALAAKGEACKPTTRLIVIVPEAPDLGAFLLETHGFYAAVELAGTFDVLRMTAAPGAMIRARLRIDQRHRIVDGQTIRWAVPVLETPGLGFSSLERGGSMEGERASLGMREAALPSETPPPIHQISPGAFMEVERNTPPPAPPLPPPRVRVPEVDPTAPVTVQGQQLKAGDGARATNAALAAWDSLYLETLANALANKGLGMDDDGAPDVIARVQAQQDRAWNARKIAAIQAIEKCLGRKASDEERHQFVADATANATSSSARLTLDQYNAVMRAAVGDTWKDAEA